MLSREEIRRRQLKGIAAAKKNGKYHGKPTKYTANNKKIQLAFRAYFIRDLHEYPLSMQDIANMAGISRQTLYRKIKRYKPRAKDYLNQKEYYQWIIRKHPESKIAKQQLSLEWNTFKYRAYGVEPPWKSQN